MTPIGVSVDVPSPLIEGVELPLAFRPDLLKAAVGGTITGVGLDPASDPESYGTALIIKVTTGETLGFQLVSPAGAAPVPFSVPYDPLAVDPNADYVARGSMWDGTTLWAMDSGVPVITKDNARSDVVLTVTEAVTPGAVRRPHPSRRPRRRRCPSRRTTGSTGSRSSWSSGSGSLALVGVLATCGHEYLSSPPPAQVRAALAPLPHWTGTRRQWGRWMLWVCCLFALVMIALVVVVLSYAVGEPSRVVSGMWRFRLPGWPQGSRRTTTPTGRGAGRRDGVRWSPRTVVDASDAGDDDGPPDVGRVRYEVRSVDRARS